MKTNRLALICNDYNGHSLRFELSLQRWNRYWDLVWYVFDIIKYIYGCVYKPVTKGHNYQYAECSSKMETWPQTVIIIYKLAIQVRFKQVIGDKVFQAYTAHKANWIKWRCYTDKKNLPPIWIFECLYYIFAKRVGWKGG